MTDPTVQAIRDRLLIASHALCYPQNGAHYCRTCSAGTANQWEHDSSCWVHHQEQDVDAARAAIQEAFAILDQQAAEGQALREERDKLERNWRAC